MRQINLSIKKITTSMMVVCLLLSVMSFVSIPIIQKSEIEKSSQLFKKHLDEDNKASEEKEKEDSNEAYDDFAHSDYTQFILNFSAEKSDFLYPIVRKVNNYIGINTPPPKG